MFSAALKKQPYLQKASIISPDQIFLVRGSDASGQSAWYYVMVDKSKRDIFKSRQGLPSLKLTDYGQILHSGFGESPPLSMQEFMGEEYHFSE